MTREWDEMIAQLLLDDDDDETKRLREEWFRCYCPSTSMVDMESARVGLLYAIHILYKRTKFNLNSSLFLRKLQMETCELVARVASA